jgi:hypothetical protein
MTKPSTLHRRRTYPRALYCSGRSQRTGTHGFRRTRSWRTYGLVALMLSGLLLSVGVVLGKALPSREAPSALPQVVQQTRVVLVKEDTLPPVMQRIAQCESRGQHFTKDGKVVRGKRNPQDTGLFQINAVVWAKKAEELGYNSGSDIHVMLALRCSSRQIIVADEQLDSTDMMGELLGKRQRRAYQA